MKRLLIILFLSLVTAPALAAGDTVRDRILLDLRDDGYREITISRTFLGRLRFVAVKSDARREIVVNPVNGVILRDYIRFLRSSDDSTAPRSGSSGSGGDDGTGSEYDDDSYDDDSYDDSYDDDSNDDDEPDDDEPDDDEVDNSGPGSENSGSGSSG